jgi:hypothetical protein
MMSARLVACTLPLLIVAFPTPRPAPRAQRSDADEIALALTAAPTSLTAGAAVYVVHDSQFVKVRDG